MRIKIGNEGIVQSCQPKIKVGDRSNDQSQKSELLSLPAAVRSKREMISASTRTPTGKRQTPNAKRPTLLPLR